MGKLNACSNCGSLDLEWIGGGGDAVFDFTGASTLSGLSRCNKCGKEVLPIEFKSKKDYEKYARALKARKKEDTPRVPTGGEKEIKLSQGITTAYAAPLTAMVAITTMLFALAFKSLASFLMALAFALLAIYLFLSKQK